METSIAEPHLKGKHDSIMYSAYRLAKISRFRPAPLLYEKAGPWISRQLRSAKAQFDRSRKVTEAGATLKIQIRFFDSLNIPM